jgi:hypothetical protein
MCSTTIGTCCNRCEPAPLVLNRLLWSDNVCRTVTLLQPVVGPEADGAAVAASATVEPLTDTTMIAANAALIQLAQEQCIASGRWRIDLPEDMVAFMRKTPLRISVDSEDEITVSTGISTPVDVALCSERKSFVLRHVIDGDRFVLSVVCCLYETVSFSPSVSFVCSSTCSMVAT